MPSSSDHHSISDGEATQGGEAAGAAVTTCPNCGDERPGAFCARCGQSDKDYSRSFWSVAGDMIRETFEVDSRLFRTMKLLLLKPGRLTTEFSRNRRVQYVSPVRLYIFASFVFFLLLSLQGPATPDFAVIPESERELFESQRPDDAQIEIFKAQLPPEQRSKVEDILGRPDGDLVKAITLGLASSSSSEDPVGTGPVDRFVLAGLIDIFHDPGVFQQRIIGNAPMAMFFMLPFYALLLAAFYFNKKRCYVEHVVFVLHSQTFVLLAYTVALLIPAEGVGVGLQIILLLASTPYYLIALRRHYDDGWARTIAKGTAIGILYGAVTTPAFLFAILWTGSWGGG